MVFFELALTKATVNAYTGQGLSYVLNQGIRFTQPEFNGQRMEKVMISQGHIEEGVQCTITQKKE